MEKLPQRLRLCASVFFVATYLQPAIAADGIVWKYSATSEGAVIIGVAGAMPQILELERRFERQERGPWKEIIQSFTRFKIQCFKDGPSVSIDGEEYSKDEASARHSGSSGTPPFLRPVSVIVDDIPYLHLSSLSGSVMGSADRGGGIRFIKNVLMFLELFRGKEKPDLKLQVFTPHGVKTRMIARSFFQSENGFEIEKFGIDCRRVYGAWL